MVMNIKQLLKKAREAEASDLHLTVGLPPMIRRLGFLEPLAGFAVLGDQEITALTEEMLQATGMVLPPNRDLDFAYTASDGARYRVNLYRAMGHLVVAIRLLRGSIPGLAELGFPEIIEKIAEMSQGLVLVTGPTGSGKSTTLAAIVDHINRHRRAHIITLEEPVEYLHSPKGCLINQRSVGHDVPSFAEALRSALREDPDIILVGEMRDAETIAAAITAAETGHLVISTLHTNTAVTTVDRIIDVFLPHQQQQIRTQLAMVLRAVVAQQLLPKKDGSARVAIQEILLVTDAVAHLIRENKGHQIASVLQSNVNIGMQSLDMALARAVKSDLIAMDVALNVATDQNAFLRLLQ